MDKKKDKQGDLHTSREIKMVVKEAKKTGESTNKFASDELMNSDEDRELNNKEKLGRVRNQLTKRVEEKKKRRKGLNERFRDKFKFIAQFFQSSKAEKAKRHALSNMNNKNVGNVANGDITYSGGEIGLNDDAWIEDSAILQYKAPPDLVLVKNNDNDGQKPFWKVPKFAKEHLALPKEKPSNSLLNQFVNGGTHLDVYINPPEDFKTAMYVPFGAEKDNIFLKYFTNEKIMLSNTIRSVIYTMVNNKKVEDSSERPIAKTESERKKGKTRGDLRVTIIPDPTEMCCYYRHNIEQLQTKEVYSRLQAEEERKF